VRYIFSSGGASLNVRCYRLPDIQRELDALRQSTLAKYNALGPGPSADPTGEVMSLLTSFVIALSRFVEGLPHRDGLLQSIRPAQLKFRRAIRETAPDFRPFERESSSQPMTMTDPLFLKSEEEGLEEEEDAVLENTSRKFTLDHSLTTVISFRRRSLVYFVHDFDFDLGRSQSNGVIHDFDFSSFSVDTSEVSDLH